MTTRKFSPWFNTLLRSPNARRKAARQRRQLRDSFHRMLRLEPLENRTLLSVTAGIIATFVGNHAAGYNGDNGPASAAQLSQVGAVAVDSAGDLFIADAGNNRVREVIQATGQIVTVAGTGSAGYNGDNIPATAAELNDPVGVAVDSQGDLFIADAGNASIREVNAAGIITTVAGSESAGYNGDGGPASAAQLADPTGVAVDNVGDIFIADSQNNAIREVNAAGVIATVAGSGSPGYSGDGGQATAATLNGPQGVAVDGTGDIFIADTGNNRIREMNAAGIITTVAGNGTAGHSGDGGQATAAKLNNPAGVALDGAGDLFIADSLNFRIREVNAASGVIITVAGSGTPGYSGDGSPAATAMLEKCQGLALNAAGDLFIPGNNSVREVGATVQQPTTLVLNVGSGVGTYGGTVSFSATLSCGAADLFGETVVFTGDGHTLGTAVTNGSGVATLGGINLIVSPGIHTVGVSFAGDVGYATSSDSDAFTVEQATPTVTVADAGGTYSGSAFTATALVAGVVTGQDTTPAASLGNVTPTLAYYTGSGVSGSSSSVAPTAIGLYTVVANFPGSTAYAAASSSPVVFSIAPPPVQLIATVAGNATAGYSGDGNPPTAAQLSSPIGVAVDSAGDLFIADSSNNVIREANATTGLISTVAGDNSPGYSGDGASATAAQLQDPTGVAVDSGGDIFIADSQNNVVREVNAATGYISTIAGTGSPGYSGDNGPATAAQLDDPTAVALDNAGNLFIADSQNNVIREVNLSSGVITTVAGNNTAGYSGDGGQPTAAQLDDPTGVALDNTGDIFIADSQNNVIREVNAAGTISTVAGNENDSAGYSGDYGLATAAQLNDPTGVAADNAGDIFIADNQNNVIRGVNLSTGIITTAAGTGTASYGGDGGLAIAAQFSGPQGLAVDGLGNLYIADSGNNVIREVAASAQQSTTLVLNAGSGVGTFGGTTTLAATLTSGDAPVVGETVAFTINGSTVGTVATDGNGVATLSGVSLAGIGVNSSLSSFGAIFAGDASYNWSAVSGALTVNQATPAVNVTDVGGTYDGSPFAAVATVAGVVTGVDDTPAASLEGVAPTLTYYTGSGVGGSSSSVAPTAVGTYTVVASFAGSADYTAASSSPVVFSISLASPGVINTVAGNGTAVDSGDGGPATAGAIDQPYGVVVDSAGNLFIADIAGNVVREVNQATGLITTVAGDGMAGYGGDGGPATAAQLDNPAGLAVDNAGNLFIADTSNNRIREVNLASGVITTVAGTSAYGYGGDGGPATAAQLQQPYSVAVDGSGDLFIADYANDRIREVNLGTGLITTVAGNGTPGYSGDGGPATAAQFDLPTALAVDGAGDLFIADSQNNAVREVNQATGLISTVAGGGSDGYSGDGGPATAAQLDNPTGLALDGFGNLFIADLANNCVREMDLVTGVITTVAGTGTNGFGGDGGPATAAELAYPAGVAVDSAGDLFIADYFNNRVREVGATILSSTTLVLNAGSGVGAYGGTATLAATLSSSGVGVANETVVFTVDGSTAGTAVTDSNGVATLPSPISLNGLGAGNYAGDIVASFLGDATYSGSTATYSGSIATAALTVSQATPTVTVTANGGTYNGSAFPATVVVAGVIAGQDTTPAPSLGGVTPTLTYYAGTYTTPADLSGLTALPGAPVDAGDYTALASYGGSTNYAAASNVADFTIAQAVLTITAVNQSKVYGAALPALTVSYAGFVGQESAADLTTLPNVTTTATASSHVSDSPHSITASGAVDPNYSFNYVAGSLAVTAAPLTITAVNKSKVYGAALPLLTVRYSGFVNNDTAANLATLPTIVTTATAASHVSSNPYSITASAAVDPDYSFTYVAGSLRVTPVPLTIIAANKTSVYGAPLPALTLGYSAFANNDTAANLTAQPTLSTTATASSHVGVYSITATGAVDSDYAFTYVAGTLSVTPAPLTITADNKTKVYGAPLPALTLSYSAFAGGDTVANLTAQPTLSTTATAASHVASSPYSITASGAVDPDYSFTYVAGTLSVTPAPLTITADNQTKVYGVALPALTVHYSAFAGNDTVASLTTLPTLSTTATASSHVAGSPYSITASGAVDPDYTFTYVAGSLTVTAAPLTITADNKEMILGDISPPLTATYVGLVNGDTPASLTAAPTLSTPATAQSPAGPYPIDISGAASSDYSITQLPGTMQVISDVGTAVLLPDPLNPAGTLLSISGTSGNTVIQITPGPTAAYVTVTFNGQSLGTFNPTSRIRIHAGGGTGTISVSPDVTLPAWLYADSGNVQLMGGGGPTLLIGGSGRDTLWGGSGPTIMIGGSGTATLVAGSGSTILIGGATAYDANSAALQDLLNTWSSPAGYATRVSQLMSDPLYPLDADTVFDSDAVDSLFGGSGMDLFFDSPGDHLRNTQSGETVITAN